MPYYFDDHGWLTTEVLPDRKTNVAPPSSVLPDGAEWNFTGHAWVAMPLIQAPIEIPPAPTATRTITKLQYMGLFTDNELRAIYTAAKAVVDVEIWLDKFKITPEVDLDDPRTIGGLQAMETAGLIGAGRAAWIASGLPPAS